MGYTFDRTEDGLLILRDILVEPDLPTTLWYLRNSSDVATESGGPSPSFARARRRTRLSEEDKADFLPDEEGHISPKVIERVEELTNLSRRFFSPTAYLRIEKVKNGSHKEVEIAGIGLESRRLRELLTNCPECALFLTTLGHGVDEPIRIHQDKDDMQGARIIEAIASAGLLDLTQRVQRRVELIAKKEKLHVTHCQWPGFCDWPEEQTIKLLPRVGGTAEHPVGWADGSFEPPWSFVGVVGLGLDVSRIKNNPCRRCDSRKDCPRRIW